MEQRLFRKCQFIVQSTGAARVRQPVWSSSWQEGECRYALETWEWDVLPQGAADILDPRHVVVHGLGVHGSRVLENASWSALDSTPRWIPPGQNRGSGSLSVSAQGQLGSPLLNVALSKMEGVRTSARTFPVIFLFIPLALASFRDPCSGKAVL